MALLLAIFRFLNGLLDLVRKRQQDVKIEDLSANRHTKRNHNLLLKALKARRKARREILENAHDVSPAKKEEQKDNTGKGSVDDI